MKIRVPSLAVLCAFCTLGTAAFAKTAKFTPLYQFPGGGDAAFPVNAGVVNVNGTLYGVSVDGGAYGRGTIFTVDASTGTETIVCSFQGLADGSAPEAC